MKKYAFSAAMWLLFEAIAVILWLTLDNLFIYSIFLTSALALRLARRFLG